MKRFYKKIMKDFFVHWPVTSTLGAPVQPVKNSGTQHRCRVVSTTDSYKRDNGGIEVTRLPSMLVPESVNIRSGDLVYIGKLEDVQAIDTGSTNARTLRGVREVMDVRKTKTLGGALTINRVMLR